jgi:hypothetical protein
LVFPLTESGHYNWQRLIDVSFHSLKKGSHR